jgi:hypothetical protein
MTSGVVVLRMLARGGRHALLGPGDGRNGTMQSRTATAPKWHACAGRAVAESRRSATMTRARVGSKTEPGPYHLS